MTADQRYALDALRQKQEAASGLLTGAVVALQRTSPADVDPKYYAAREMMFRAWEMLGNKAYADMCIARAKSVGGGLQALADYLKTASERAA